MDLNVINKNFLILEESDRKKRKINVQFLFLNVYSLNCCGFCLLKRKGKGIYYIQKIEHLKSSEVP